MLTIDALREVCADAQAGLNRCMKKEVFFFRMVKMGVSDAKFEQLGKALEEKDLDTAFELAHALKGVTANLALTPILVPLNQITELLRARTDTDYSELYRQTMEARNALVALCE